MDTQTLLNNQPAGTAVFGNQTQAVDLSVYRTQILDIMTNADTAWQNQLTALTSTESTALLRWTYCW